MAAPNNILQTVITYQKAELAWLLNQYCAIHLANKKFEKFNDLTANLGDTVSFDKTPRYVTAGGLVITQQQSQQRVQNLVCSQASNVSAAYTDQQFIFNVRDYMDRFGMAAIKELGNEVESDILQSFNGTQRNNNPQSSSYGQLVDTTSGGYRFFGNAVTAINTYQQLAQAVANFKDFGASDLKLTGMLPTVSIPAFIGSGLNQFVPDRNDEIAVDWRLGKFATCTWHESNLLPLHVSGTLGDAAAPNNVLTLVSTNDPTGANITQLTLTEPTAGTDANAVKAGDLMQFNDGVSGFANLRYLQWIGHKPSNQPVQMRITNDAGTPAGTFTVSIYPPLCSQSGNANQNLNTALVAGMTLTIVPSHRSGNLYSGDQFYVAMPQLPDQSPFTTMSTMDKDTGASIRHYYGVQFGQNVRSYVRDAIWGATVVAENHMRFIFPM